MLKSVDMSLKIEVGQSYLLDGKIPVKVIKAVNRSLTIFNVEFELRGVESVAASRLRPFIESAHRNG